MKELHNTDWSGLHSCVALVTVTSVWGGVRWVVGSGPAFLSPGWLVGTGAGPWPGLEMERETQPGQARPGWDGWGHTGTVMRNTLQGDGLRGSEGII